MNPRNVHELMKAFPSVDAQVRDWINLVERDGAMRTAELARLIDTHVPGADLLVWVSRKIANYLPRDGALLFIAEHVGQGEIRITDRQFQGFVVVATNGVGTGWSMPPPNPLKHLKRMTRALFLCTHNRLRSPTAEQVFATWPGIETDSAGLGADADVPLSPEQLAWAEIVFVMEKKHKARLSSGFRRHLNGKRVVCLDIPDEYSYMQPELVRLLETKAGRFLRQG